MIPDDQVILGVQGGGVSGCIWDGELKKKHIADFNLDVERQLRSTSQALRCFSFNVEIEIRNMLRALLSFASGFCRSQRREAQGGGGRNAYSLRRPDHQGNPHVRESRILAPGRPRIAGCWFAVPN